MFMTAKPAGRKPSAFTLIELIIVILVVIVLAAIALPNLARARKRAIDKEGLSNVRLLAAAELIHRQDTGSFAACVCAPSTCNVAGGCNVVLDTTLNTNNWTYSATGTASSTITATGSTGCTYNFASANFISGSPVAGTGCV